ncbi:MAG: transposase [Oceanicoccus sp.]|uniref:transposase n=1 Tax=Oceanicoccus sp. TaxID=2691044 RepID=UPI00260B8E38|nr:transposase [Oceanicoccus sp.]MCP3908272.1 transposase [Oceanicoccus sp.]
MRKQLYRSLTIELQKRLPGASKPQVGNLALLTQALVFSPNCHLNNLALEFPIVGRQDSLINRLRRFLDNCHISRYKHYLPLVRSLFAHWPDKEVSLVMDRTDIRQEKSILLLATAFKHRVIPLTWRVLPFGGTGEELQKELLQEIKPYLPANKRIMFYGDTEFRAVKVQRYCRQKKWGWQLGVKSDTLYHSGDEKWQALNSIQVDKGERRYINQVTLTKKHAWSDVHLMVDWTHQADYPRYVVCHQAANKQNWRRGRKRFWIEPTFRDWKSYGFDLEASCLEDDHRLDCLLLGMAVATLWLLHLGHWVKVNGRATWLTANHRRDYSLFRLGRDYARRSQLHHWDLPICFHR